MNHVKIKAQIFIIDVIAINNRERDISPAYSYLKINRYLFVMVIKK